MLRELAAKAVPQLRLESIGPANAQPPQDARGHQDQGDQQEGEDARRSHADILAGAPLAVARRR